jgi:hypothetical protein
MFIFNNNSDDYENEYSDSVHDDNCFPIIYRAQASLHISGSRLQR